MTDSRYFEGVKNQKCFNRQQVLQSFRNAGYQLSDASFYKRFASMVKDGDLARVGNGLYCLLVIMQDHMTTNTLIWR